MQERKVRKYRIAYECPECQLMVARRSVVKSHCMGAHNMNDASAEIAREKARKGFEEIASVVKFDSKASA
jgi:hypothetical protein